MTEKIIHHTIPQQLSRYLNDEYPLFVAFIKRYYEWLETPGTPYHLVRNHLDYLNFKDSIDEYLNQMRNEYLHGLPDDILADKELLIKHARDIHSVIGTEQGFKFLFRILYDKEVQVVYPKDNILRSSDGKWISDEYIIYMTMRTDPESLLYKRLTQIQEVKFGYPIEVSGVVHRVTRRYSGGFQFVEIVLTNLRGQFNTKSPVIVNNVEEWILPKGVPRIISGGLNYATNNPVTYAGVDTWDVEFISTTAGSVDSRYRTTLTKDDVALYINNERVYDFIFNGETFYHDDIRVGDNIKISYPVYPGRITIAGVSGDTKAITSISMIDSPIGILENQPLQVSGGLNAILECTPEAQYKVDGRFSNVDGFLSEKTIVLQDSYYWQDFSYVLKTDMAPSDYEQIVKDLMHPSGMQMFSRVSIIEELDLSIKIFELYLTLKGLDIDSYSTEYGMLYTTNSFLEDMKSWFDDSYTVQPFLHLSVERIVQHPQEHLNTPDSLIEVRITAEGDNYWLPGYIADDPVIYIEHSTYVDEDYVDEDYVE